MGLVKTRRLAAMQKQQRAKAGMNAAGTGLAKPLKNGPFVGPVPKSSKEKIVCCGIEMRECVHKEFLREVRQDTEARIWDFCNF